MIDKLTARLKSFVALQPSWFFMLYASLAAFFTYSCMYAFRKPFTIAEFNGYSLLGVHYKIWMISAQVLGYTLSKFIGIKFVSEIKPAKRAISILVLVGIAELSLLLVYLVPYPYNFVFMFLNGLPLGIIWGLVFSYLEGRALTELLGAILSVSFIVASGVVKSAGKFLMVNYHTSEFAMPFLTGALFIVPLILSVFLLDSIPPPTPTDIALRTKREPMDKTQRKAFLKEFFTVIVLMVLAYVFLTIFREIRDNFANEIWAGLGLDKDPAIFTIAEIPVALFSLLILSLLVFIKSNIKALQAILWIILAGFILIILSSVLFTSGLINGITWMILVGTGIYLGYIPFNAFLYERMISAFKCVGNVGFVMYISDAFGYLGSLGVVFFKNFFSPSISWMNFFIQIGCWVSIAGILLISLCIIYFTRKYHFTSNHQTSDHGKNIDVITRKPLFAFNTWTSFHK
jgi:hypothetical protein